MEKCIRCGWCELRCPDFAITVGAKHKTRKISELSRCAWEALRAFFRETVPQGDAVPRAVIAIQTFGDLLGFNRHCHVLCTDGCFDEKALFWVAPRFGPEGLKAIFEHNMFRMFLSKEKITQDLVDMLRSWRHSGFQV
jgi:ferredoxin